MDEVWFNYSAIYKNVYPFTNNYGNSQTCEPSMCYNKSFIFFLSNKLWLTKVIKIKIAIKCQFKKEIRMKTSEKSISLVINYLMSGNADLIFHKFSWI